MAIASPATPILLTDPGTLFWAPIGSTEPTTAVTASIFSDTWPVAWIPLGMTASGSSFEENTTVTGVPAAESFYDIQQRTTAKAGTVTFNLLSVTATNLSRTLNGAPTTVTGATTTTLTKIDPVVPGQEARCMIGWESLDNTVRFIARQVINSGAIKFDFAKAPASTQLPWTGVLEKPTSTLPWVMWTAGVARA